VTSPRATLYTLPFRLADIIDPAALPISDSTTSELSMKLCVLRRSFERVTSPDFSPSRILALAHQLQLGIPLSLTKQHAVALGDLSNAVIHRFFTYFMTVYGCHLDQERRRNFDLIHVQASLTQLCLETVLTMVEADDPFSFVQAYCFMASSCFYTYTYVPAERYLKKAADTTKRRGIRMVDRSFSDSSDSPNRNMIMDPPPEHSESVQERVATLVQLISIPLQYRLLTGKDIPVSIYLEDQFRNELPVGCTLPLWLTILLTHIHQYAYPRMWDEMPEVLRLRALLLVYEADKLIETYNSSCEFIVACDHFPVSHNTSSPFHVCLVVGMSGRCATTHRSERPTGEEGHRLCHISGSRGLPDISVLQHFRLGVAGSAIRRNFPIPHHTSQRVHQV